MTSEYVVAEVIELQAPVWYELIRTYKTNKMHSWILLVLVASFFKAASSLSENAYCLANDKTPYINFGTKSSYEHHHNIEGVEQYPGCKPVYFWMLSRHGTRWPGDKDDFLDLLKIKDMIISNWNDRRGEMCNEDVENLMAWKFDMRDDQANQLTVQGRDDLFSLGRRFRSYFPELLATSYDSKSFVIRHTNTSRTKESAEYFYKGVFGMNFDDPNPSLHEAMAAENLIYPYKNCPQFDSSEVDAKKERSMFEKSDLVVDVVARVSRRLGFDYNLTYGNIKSMYDGCRYQKAWLVYDTSPWCAVFVVEDLEVLEYNEDLKYYYTSGPGSPMNLKLACPIVKDLVDRFTSYETDPASQPQGVFYLSHVTMVNMLSTRLGLIDQPEPLKAEGYRAQKDRNFRTSNIVPFGGNVAAVLYSCADGLNVVFYQSERKVLLKGCEDGLCKLSFLRDLYNFTQDPACTDNSFCFYQMASGTRPTLLSPSIHSPLLIIMTSILIYLKYS